MESRWWLPLCELKGVVIVVVEGLHKGIEGVTLLVCRWQVAICDLCQLLNRSGMFLEGCAWVAPQPL